MSEPRLYIKIDDLTADEEICDLMGDLGGQNLETTLELMNRIVTVVNLQMWDTLQDIRFSNK